MDSLPVKPWNIRDEKKPDHQVLHQLAMVYRDRQMWTQAGTCFRRLLKAEWAMTKLQLPNPNWSIYKMVGIYIDTKHVQTKYWFCGVSF